MICSTHYFHLSIRWQYLSRPAIYNGILVTVRAHTKYTPKYRQLCATSIATEYWHALQHCNAKNSLRCAWTGKMLTNMMMMTMTKTMTKTLFAHCVRFPNFLRACSSHTRADVFAYFSVSTFVLYFSVSTFFLYCMLSSTVGFVLWSTCICCDGYC